MRLYLVCDISGSMAEGGKLFIMRTAVLAIGQWVQLGYGHAVITLCSWAADAQVLAWDPAQEYPAPLLVAGGSSSAEALIGLLGDQPDGKVLLFSDGFWSQAEARLLRQWKTGLQPDTLRIVKTGADADPVLKGPDVYAPEELFAMLDGWLEAAAI